MKTKKGNVLISKTEFKENFDKFYNKHCKGGDGFYKFVVFRTINTTNKFRSKIYYKNNVFELLEIPDGTEYYCYSYGRCNGKKSKKSILFFDKNGCFIQFGNYSERTNVNLTSLNKILNINVSKFESHFFD